MKKILFLLAGALIFSNLFVSTGCEDDPVDPVTPDPPFVILSGTPDATTTFEPGDSITITVDASVGTEQLNSIVITEDGVNIDGARITYPGIDLANTVQLVPDADQGGFVWDVTIQLHDEPSIRTYEVVVTDKGGLSDGESFNVEVIDPATPLNKELTGILLNSAGPVGTGGLDLDDGIGTGSSDPIAEIKDEGVDIGAPDPAFNWKKQISGVNGCTLKYVDTAALPEGWTYDGVTSLEQIAEAWNTGTEFTVSLATEVGDLIVVQNADASRTYLLRVDNIFEDNTVQTATSNDDGYEFSIKY